MARPIFTYQSDGLAWDEGEVPECSYCGKQPNEKGPSETWVYLHETPVNGIILCEDTECMSNFVMDECPRIELVKSCVD